MIQHAQTHAVHAAIERTAFVFAGHQHRLVDGIRVRKRQAFARCFIAIGAAEQVDIPLLERLYCSLPVGIAQHSNRHLQYLADQAGIFGGESLIVAPATGYVEGRIIRC
ncbi:hypothetical protein D3C79_782850 [compost metagenome]